METVKVNSGDNFNFFLTRKIGIIIDDTMQTLSREAAKDIEQKTKSKVVVTTQSRESVGDTAVISVFSDKEHFEDDKKVVSGAFEKLKAKVEPTGDNAKNILEIAGG